MSTPGRSNNETGGIAGFTLIELIVVIALLSLFLAVTLPRLGPVTGMESGRQAGMQLQRWIEDLKTRAVDNQQDLALVIDLDASRLWVAAEPPDPDAGVPDDAYQLPSSVRIQAVVYPGYDRVTGGRTRIVFRHSGVSDHARIVFDDDDNPSWGLAVEPFLPRVVRYDSDEGMMF